MDGVDSSRKSFEWRRKIFHICVGVVFSLLFYFNIMNLWIGLALFTIGVLVSIVYMHIKLPVIDWFLKTFERQAHIKDYPGRSVIAMLFSMILLTFFEKNIAIASIMVWTFGDATAALFGIYHGKHKYKNKTWEGFAAGFVIAAFVAAFFVPIYAAIIASLIAMLAEFVELEILKLDDNILVPLISAIVMFVLLSL